jgi:cell division protein FtsW
MSGFARTDTSVLGRWWWTVDRWSVVALMLLFLIGALMVFAASPSVADRIGLDSYHFVKRQLTLLPAAAGVMIAVSLLSARQIRRTATIGLAICVALMVLTLVIGLEVKGARRWLSLGGFNVQISEFVKPFLAVVSAWMFAEWRRGDGVPGHFIAIALYVLVTGLLLLQPDLGMTVVVSATWGLQFFIAGMPMVLVGGLLAGGVALIIGAYFTLPHVTSRIDRFLYPQSGDTYQVDRSLEAFANGGLIGTGPGEGVVKSVLPDAHADFVFSVAGEEFGALAALVIIALFSFVVLRGFARVFAEERLFVTLAAAGLFAQFGLQALVHMASSLQLIPAKGMTLPFISYGGSSLLALAIGMGMALALTRDNSRPGALP